MASAAKVKEARAEYTAVKKLYHSLGKKAAGKPKSSTVQKDYREVKREYQSAGRALGKLTGRKPRKSR